MPQPCVCIVAMPSGNWCKFTYDFKARAFTMSDRHVNICFKPDDLIRVYGETLREMVTKLPTDKIMEVLSQFGKYKKISGKVPLDAIAKICFKVILEHVARDPYDLSARREAEIAAGTRQARKKDGLRYEILYDAKVKKHAEAFEGLPRQAKLCVTALLAKQQAEWKLDQPTVEKIIDELRDELKTKQEPWRVFKFYQTKLIQLDLLRIRRGGE